MIIGNGDLATALKKVDKPNLLFFASGVSNSKETRRNEYHREENLLLKQDRKQHIVYFSSLAVFESNTPYIQHKRRMEHNIKKNFKVNTIVRIGNISWGKNPHTLINFIRNKIKHKQVFDIQDVYRYIIDEDEFLYWIKRIPEWSCEMNITGKRLKVIDIIEQYGYGEQDSY